jgi:hypothetical protein
MSDLSDVCTLCSADIAAQLTGTGQPPVVISADVHVTQPCFVRDQIEFRDTGRLIFDISTDVREYAVVCRKLIVNGGNQPITVNPCNPGDPGTRYNTNVITWNARLASAASGATVVPPSAADGAAGADGQNGTGGNDGSDGESLGGSPRQKQLPVKLVVIALEVEYLNSGNLVIDWAGQDGGDGGKGQNGGNGGKGAAGSKGKNASWPSSGCDTPTGDGGDGGNGGFGGNGGNGGNGGDAGQIIVISTPQNLSGVFNDPGKVTFVTASVGGTGGPGGHGGLGGAGGNPGIPSSDCGPASKGADGSSLLTLLGGTGAPGNPGTSTTPTFEPVTTGACAGVIPVALLFDASNVLPQVLRRCSAATGSGNISLTGQFLDQIASVATSLTGVTATIQNSSTDTELDLSFSIAANSQTGLGDLLFTYNFPGTFATPNLTGAIDVEVLQAVSIAPASGAQGTTVSPVTITVQDLDLSAASYDVSVSGVGVNAVNITVVSNTTITCDFVIDPTAAKTVRAVTVQAGPVLNPCQSTLTNSFTVT